jgi:hypothetical protein
LIASRKSALTASIPLLFTLQISDMVDTRGNAVALVFWGLMIILQCYMLHKIRTNSAPAGLASLASITVNEQTLKIALGVATLLFLVADCITAANSGKLAETCKDAKELKDGGYDIKIPIGCSTFPAATVMGWFGLLAFGAVLFAAVSGPKTVAK